MKVRILKDHISGLKKDAISNPSDSIARELIVNGIAEEYKEVKKVAPKTKK